MTPQVDSTSRNELLTEDAKPAAPQAAPGSAALSSQPATLLDLVLQVTRLDPANAQAAVERFLPSLKPWLKSPLAAVREEALGQIDVVEAQLKTQVDRITRDFSFQQLRTV